MEGAAEPGERLGLPKTGPGSVPGVGRRFVALLLDFVACGLVVGVFLDGTARRIVEIVVVAVFYALTSSLFGQTFGMRLLGLRVVDVESGKPPRLWSAVLRTLLLLLIFPAALYDRDRRGLHDHVARTVVVRS